MTDEPGSGPTFRRRPASPTLAEIAARAAQELRDLKSDAQWAGAPTRGEESRDVAPVSTSAEPASRSLDVARVQAMVPRRLRDDFLVAARRQGTNAQKAIADFVRAYVRDHNDRN